MVSFNPVASQGVALRSTDDGDDNDEGASITTRKACDQPSFLWNGQ